jgi:hypothetical protein
MIFWRVYIFDSFDQDIAHDLVSEFFVSLREWVDRVHAPEPA